MTGISSLLASVKAIRSRCGSTMKTAPGIRFIRRIPPSIRLSLSSSSVSFAASFLGSRSRSPDCCRASSCSSSPIRFLIVTKFVSMPPSQRLLTYGIPARVASWATGSWACFFVPTKRIVSPRATVSRTASRATSSRLTVWARSMMWIPLRSAKMNGRILGFQRRVWWPKWTPASSRCRIETDGTVCDLLFGSFLRGPHRRGPDLTGNRLVSGTVPVGTVRVCAPHPWVAGGGRAAALRGRRSVAQGSALTRPRRPPRAAAGGSAAQDVPVVPDSRPGRAVDRGLDEHEIEAEREVRQQSAVGKPAAVEQPERGVANPAPFPPVERLLSEAEVAPRSPTDLDRDQHRRRPRVDRDDVQLAPTHADVAGQHGPAGRRKVVCDGDFGRVAQHLPRGPHPFSLPRAAALAITRPARGGRRAGPAAGDQSSPDSAAPSRGHLHSRIHGETE